MDDPTENMSKEDALFHWATAKNPWEIDGAVRRAPRSLQPLDPDVVVVNDVGNVVFMPPVAGMPCFGLPMPYLRFIHGRAYDPIEDRAIAMRCGRCRLEAACGKVVSARTSWAPSLKRLTEEYVVARQHLTDVTIENKRANHPAKFDQARQDRYAAARRAEKRANTFLRGELYKYHWVSFNDRVMSQQNQADKIEAARKARKARRRLLANGTIPPEYDAALMAEARERERILRNYAREPSADVHVKKMPETSLARDVAVWSHATRLGWEGKPATPYSIAQRLGADTPDRVNSLRSSVAAALKRIKRYEGEIAHQGKLLWAPFDPENWID